MYSYLLYIAGVLLLTPPTGLFFRSQLKGASLAELAEKRRIRFAWIHPINAIDLLRAYCGMLLLSAGFDAVHPSASGQLVTRIVLTSAALVGLFLQHNFYQSERDELPAPVAYIIGLILAILPPEIALLALPLGVVLALVMQNLGAGLLLAAVSTVALGVVFGLSLISVGTAGFFIFLPVLLAAMMKRRLVLSIRKGQPTRYRSVRDIPVTASR